MSARKLSLKWFGSLTNLSPRRSRDKDAPSRPADDGEPRLHPPGYARSSDMYTHVGTAPRRERQKRKAVRGGRSQRAAGECVRDSPLLSALSGLGGTSMEPPEPACVTPSRPPADDDPPVQRPPVQQPPVHQPPVQRPPVQRPPVQQTPVHQPPVQRTPVQRPPVQQPPVHQPPVHQPPVQRPPVQQPPVQQSSNLAHPPAASAQDVYVPMDPIADRVAGQLDGTESEAGSQDQDQDQDQDRDQDQDHIRPDRPGRGGEYVKFSRERWWLQPPPDHLTKQLEEELTLRERHVRSHAWYHGPIPREVSETLLLNDGDFLLRDSQSGEGDFVLSSRWEQRSLHLPVRRTPSTQTSSRVQYGLEEEEGEEGEEAFASLPALVHFYVGGRVALRRGGGGGVRLVRPVNRTFPLSYLETAFSSPSSSHHQGAEVEQSQETLLSPLDRHTPPPGGTSPPSAPARSGRPRPSSDHCYTELRPGPQTYVDRLRAGEGARPPRTDFSPVMETLSCFRPGGYASPLMPRGNKPLEAGILRRVKEVLADLDPRTAAKHITKADCTVARILQVTPEVQRMMGVSSGLELLTLPHGQQLRLDLLERFQTMAVMLAVNVLGCTGTSEERAALLHKLIQVAAELKSAMGNMFGFAAVMRALELPQVSRLEQTWTALRQRHTEGAILYEKTLRPFLKGTDAGRESFPLSSTTFPHVLPLLALLEKSGAVLDAEPWDGGDVGVDVVMFHLGAARTVAQLGGNYRSNAEGKLQGFQEQAEVMELFLTDFQMRLLWGSRGAEADQALRHDKFQQVLTALSYKLEPPIRKH